MVVLLVPVVFGLMGFAVDLGRLYSARNDLKNAANAIAQAKGFAAAVGVTGAILTKLDGTPKGGVAFAITSELGIPIHYIGTGEKISDLERFDARAFVDGLF